MTFYLILLAVSVACANAGFIGSPAVSYGAPAVPLAYAAPLAKTIDTEYDPHPQYSYAYDVQDRLTGDSKTQQETRDGDVVHGSYSVLESDGTRRVVHYTADDHNGFNAVVEKQPAAIAVKTVAAAPLPVTYAAAAAPVVKTIAPGPALTYATAPVVKTIAPGPALTYAAAPVVKTIAPGPALTYSAAPVIKTIAPGPALTYSAAPVIKTIAPAPAVTYSAGPAIAYSSPIVKTYASAAPVGYSSPLIKTYAAATPIVKTIAAAPAHSYASQYTQTYSAPIITKYAAAAPAFGYSYNSIPVAHAAAPIAYSHDSKWA